MPFQTVLLFVVITNWKRKDHLNVGVYKQNWQWTLNEDPLNAKSDISETESSQDIICFNTPFMSDATFKVSVEYISSSQHINEILVKRISTLGCEPRQRQAMKEGTEKFLQWLWYQVMPFIHFLKKSARGVSIILDEWVDDISTLKMSTPSVISPA